jgi:Sec-independent protein translocase protein TatA
MSPRKLPELGRLLGKGIAEFKRDQRAAKLTGTEIKLEEQRIARDDAKAAAPTPAASIKNCLDQVA